jgi:hypothetical protein
LLALASEHPGLSAFRERLIAYRTAYGC